MTAGKLSLLGEQLGIEGFDGASDNIGLLLLDALETLLLSGYQEVCQVLDHFGRRGGELWVGVGDFNSDGAWRGARRSCGDKRIAGNRISAHRYQ